MRRIEPSDGKLLAARQRARRGIVDRTPEFRVGMLGARLQLHLSGSRTRRRVCAEGNDG